MKKLMGSIVLISIILSANVSQAGELLTCETSYANATIINGVFSGTPRTTTCYYTDRFCVTKWEQPVSGGAAPGGPVYYQPKTQCYPVFFSDGETQNQADYQDNSGNY